MQTLFTALITIQFIVVVLHDWLEIPGLTHGRQVQAVVGRQRLLMATIVNAMFPGLAVGLAYWYWHIPHPTSVANYWVAYCAVTLGSAIFMWYIPYFFGASEEKKREYRRMYENTRHILPPRNDNPRPNVLHICFHALFVITFGLSICLRMLSYK